MRARTRKEMKGKDREECEGSSRIEKALGLLE
jgi:hypothetical protein